ncbi:MAG: hypothetical protein NTV89_10840 [Proteobacteria bacterium]|nr:hypothetical protein [Pseudomonadota bacterium]
MEKTGVKDKKSPAPIEKRIQELIDQCRGIPPGEVMQLLRKAQHNPALDVEKELEKLFRKYKTENSE